MSSDKAVRRLTVLQGDAGKEPTPQRKFFHIGQPEIDSDLGECIPMISWVEDNLSRFVVSDGPSTSWGRGESPPRILSLPNRGVKVEDGIFVVTGPGNDHSIAHPNGKSQIHFVHLGVHGKLWDKGLVKIYVYRLEGVQMKSLLEKKQ